MDPGVAHASFSLKALNVLSFADCGLCASCSLWHMMTSVTPLFSLPPSLPPSIFVPPQDVLQSHALCQPAHFSSSHVSGTLRFWAPHSQHKTAEQDAHNPCPDFLRELYWKIKWMIFLPANTLPGWSRGLGLSICWRREPPHRPSLVPITPAA